MTTDKDKTINSNNMNKNNNKKLLALFFQMRNAVAKPISYELFDAYYRILKRHAILDENNYLFYGDYAATLAHASVEFENPNYDKDGYERIISDLSDIIRKVTLIKLYDNWEETIKYYIGILEKGYVNLIEFNEICSFLSELITAGIVDSRVSALANALLNARVTGINNIKNESEYRQYRFQVLGMINQLENPTKKDPTK